MKSNEDVNHQDEVIEVPKLRFIPFNKPWGKSKLKDIATFINGRAYKQNELLDSGKYRVLRVGNFFTNTSWYFSDLELNHKYYAEEGDLLYTWSASFGPHIWHGEKLIYHYHIWKIELSDKTDKLFAKYLLDYDKEKILSDKNGSTMVHITKKGMEEKEVNLPSYSEQIKIGIFLKNLDDVISLHQQELDALKQTKQGFLQRMFPKEGETVPEVRLPSFSDEWAPWKLSDITDLITKGTTPKNMSNEGLINFVKVENINPFSNQITSYSKISLEEHNGNLKRSQLKKNDILFSIAGTLGRTAIVKEKDLPANTNQALAILRMKNTNIDFITTYLKGKLVKDYIRKNPTIGAQPNLSLQQLKDLHVFLPSNQEQIKIGEFFKQMDEVINLKQQELEALKQTKQGFLQKMFI
ncbi:MULTISPECIES: restriction endonuclease subunit S [unclassified Exiguobacterium]|uniref:restriction endonuclease subunit S n=1 Tax=unclassified Exiguobacterium TaxID=2644629 RepID=UPI001BED084F|nr:MULTISPECIES: restriction endonuclease subunit S [unclassified Exiguobacterium]